MTCYANIPKMKLSLDLTLEPVKVDSVGSEGFAKEHLVKPSFFCLESVPAAPASNRYEISVYTDASHSREVLQLHNQLIMILEEIDEVWPIVTGYRLGSSNIKQTDTPGYISNLDEVIAELQGKEGMKSVTSSLSYGWQIWNGYEKPPVADALTLRNACISDPELKKVIGYYRKALENKDYWFVPLYKIKDQLNSIHKKKAKSELGINEKHLSFFESKLNNYDLRHPGKGDKEKPIDDIDKNKLFVISRCWIAKELEFRSLPFRKIKEEKQSNLSN